MKDQRRQSQSRTPRWCLGGLFRTLILLERVAMPPSTHLQPFLCFCLPLVGVPSVSSVAGLMERHFSPELPYWMWVEKIPPATCCSSRPGNRRVLVQAKRSNELDSMGSPINFGGGGSGDLSVCALLLLDSAIIWAKLREFIISGYFFCSSSNAITTKGRIRVNSRIHKEQSVGASTHLEDTSD